MQIKAISQAKERPQVHNVFIPKHWVVMSLATLTVITLLAYHVFVSTDNLNITNISSLTTTDNKELRPSYSPDGRYIAFERYIDGCQNQLWAKDTHNNKEYLLTEEVGVYGTPIWSPDGSQVIFSSVTQCSKHQVLEGCEELRAVSFALAKSSPQATREILSCNNENFHSPVWLDNENIAFISSENAQDKLLTLSLQDEKLSTLYRAQRESLHSLDYSNHLNLLALSKSDAVHNFSLVLIDPETSETTTTPLQSEDKQNNFWHFSWHPNQASLITSKGQSLYTLDLNGKLTESSFPTRQNIYTPRYHPQANSIVAAIGAFDPDIGQLSWDTIEGSQMAKNIVKNKKIFARSTVAEIDAKYQPHGNKIAFISDREGKNQIWLLNSIENNSPPSQLSYFSGKDDVNSFVWSPDGSIIIVNLGNGLTLLDLSGELTPIKLNFDVLDIYHTIGENKLLLKVIENNQYAIKLFNFDNYHSETLYLGASQGALITEQGDLFLIDDKLVLNQLVGSSLLPVKGFFENKSLSIFHGENNTILVADSRGKLWQFNTDSSLKSLFFSPEEYIGTVSDILFDKKTLLFSKVVSIQKEIVVLDLQ